MEHTTEGLDIDKFEQTRTRCRTESASLGADRYRVQTWVPKVLVVHIQCFLLK